MYKGLIMKKSIRTRKDMLIKKINALKPKDLDSLEYWFNTAKDDRWYDYGYFISIIRKKVHQMRDNWYKAHYKNSEKEEIELKNMSEILDRLYFDRYEENAYKNIEKKYGKLEYGPDDYSKCFPITFTFGGAPVDEIPNIEEEIKEEVKKAHEEKKGDFIKLSQFMLELEKYWD